MSTVPDVSTVAYAAAVPVVATVVGVPVNAAAGTATVIAVTSTPFIAKVQLLRRFPLLLPNLFNNLPSLVSFNLEWLNGTINIQLLLAKTHLFSKNSS